MLPTLETTRLLLRPLTADDGVTIAHLAGRREIAATTISIPHPCSVEQAQQWIASHAGAESSSRQLVFGITARQGSNLIGAVGLRDINVEHSQAEVGFWIGVEWWGMGYATEAARAVLRYAFQELNLNRVCAHHMLRNPASARVLTKLGMQQEGLLRQRVRKWGVFEDVVVLAILRSDWEKIAEAGSNSNL